MAKTTPESVGDCGRMEFGLPAQPLCVAGEGRWLTTIHALGFCTDSKVLRLGFVLLTYTLGITASLWLAYQVRFDFSVPPQHLEAIPGFLVWIIPLKLLFVLLIRQCDGLLSYFSIPDLRRLITSLATASGVLLLAWWLSEAQATPPRGVILTDLLISCIGISAVRLCFRIGRQKFALPGGEWQERTERVGIVGAGDVGASLALELLNKGHLEIRPVAFLDDDPRKWNYRIHNIPVVGPPECLLREGKRLRLDRVILAMPSLQKKRLRELMQLFRETHVAFESVPSFDQLATGQVKIANPKPLDTQEVFGHKETLVKRAELQELVRGKTILVTGAGGSIGSELCRQLAGLQPQRLLLVEECEVQIFKIEQELVQMGHRENVSPIVADILDRRRLHSVFQRHRPDIVFHAAAHKQERMLEEHPGEALQTNALGTRNVAELAFEFQVRELALISSTVAGCPDSVVAATKRLAEMIVQGMGAEPGAKTRCVVVRFSEVIGASDKLVRRFQEQIACGGPVHIGHPEAFCFSMTLSEAAALVLQSLVQGRTGEVLQLDPGAPIKLLDLAHRMIERSGFEPDQDIEIEFGKPRLGEISQETMHSPAALAPTAHPRIHQVPMDIPAWGCLRECLQKMAGQLHENDTEELIRSLRKLVPGYQPKSNRASLSAETISRENAEKTVEIIPC